jgi:hypothetical protein
MQKKNQNFIKFLNKLLYLLFVLFVLIDYFLLDIVEYHLINVLLLFEDDQYHVSYYLLVFHILFVQIHIFLIFHVKDVYHVIIYYNF